MMSALIPFARDIWLADGTDVFVLGFRYPTRCAVMQLPQGGLLIWSPVMLSDDLRAAVDALGPVTHLIAPNHFHHLFIAEWQQAYPQARLFGLPGLSDKRTDLHFEGLLGDIPHPDWTDVLDQKIIHNKLTDEAIFFHKPSNTVIFTDLIQQFPRGFHKGWRSIVARLDMMVGDTPNVPRKFRLGFRDKAKARASVNRALEWPIERVLLAHGMPVRSDGHAVLKRTFRWLIG